MWAAVYQFVGRRVKVLWAEPIACSLPKRISVLIGLRTPTFDAPREEIEDFRP